MTLGSEKPQERSDLQSEVDAKRGLIGHRRRAPGLDRPKIKGEANAKLHREGSADMKEIEGAAGAARCRFREVLRYDGVTQDGRGADASDRDPRQPRRDGPAQDQRELRQHRKAGRDGKSR